MIASSFWIPAFWVLVFACAVVAVTVDPAIRRSDAKARLAANLVRTADQGLIACAVCGNPTDPDADPFPERTAEYRETEDKDYRQPNRRHGQGMTPVRMKDHPFLAGTKAWYKGVGWTFCDECGCWGPSVEIARRLPR